MTSDRRLPAGLTPRYGVIYADPPWTFATRSAKGKGRSAEAWYDCMDFADIMLMNGAVREAAAEDCVLLLWTADPFLERAFEVIRAWGFIYKTVGFYWAKTLEPPLELQVTDLPAAAPKYGQKERSTGNSVAQVVPRWAMGTGSWTRANPEQCLLATRGHPKRLNADVRKLIVAPRREHSRKPDKVYEQIERLCAGPYLEMFARFPREGWACWGNENGIGARRWRSDMRDPADG